MPQIEIRPYQEEDWPRLNEIHDSARRQELQAAGLDDAYLSLAQTYENEGLFQYQLYVALIGGHPVGFIAFDEGSIDWLYVDPLFQRRGIARALIEHALQLLSGEVRLEVLCGNTAALRLYESLGFQTIEIKHGRLAGNERFAASGHIMLCRPS